jgi:hypothetical protein
VKKRNPVARHARKFNQAVVMTDRKRAAKAGHQKHRGARTVTNKLKTVTINATMATDLYLDVNVPESATEEQIWKLIRSGFIDGGDMMQDESWGSGGWTWGMPELNCDFDPKADDISKSFLASLPEEDEFE